MTNPSTVTGFYNPSSFCYADDLFLKSPSDIEAYLLKHYGGECQRKFVVLQLDINDRILEESKLSGVSDFKYMILKLAQSFILNNSAKLIVARISRNDEDIVKPNDYKYSKTLKRLTKIFGIRLVDYIVVKANEIESFKHDHGSIE